MDYNSDGRIDYAEFMNKFKANAFDDRLKARAAARLAKLKELMMLHMTSANDAFRFFDTDKNNCLSFTDFSRLVTKAHELAGEKPPTFLVVKDLFDTVDIRKDGEIDLHEWQQTFGHVAQGNNKLSIKPTPLSMWENTRDFDKIGSLIAKNRKQLMEQFKQTLGEEGTSFTLDEGHAVLDNWLHSHFKGQITNEQLRCLFSPALIHSQS